MKAEPDKPAHVTVMSYIHALDRQDYDTARKWLSEELRVRGPAGEAFRDSKDFIDMLRQYQGKYDLKKVFTDGDEVCLLYDLKRPKLTVFMCSCTRSRTEKITSIQTVFDPRPFRQPHDEQKG